MSNKRFVENSSKALWATYDNDDSRFRFCDRVSCFSCTIISSDSVNFLEGLSAGAPLKVSRGKRLRVIADRRVALLRHIEIAA